MAKQDKKQGKGKKDRDRRGEQVRSAVDQAFQAAGGAITRDRAQELADELTTAAVRVRETLEELRPPTSEELRRLGERLDVLEARVAELERPAPAREDRRAQAGREDRRAQAGREDRRAQVIVLIEQRRVAWVSSSSPRRSSARSWTTCSA